MAAACSEERRVWCEAQKERSLRFADGSPPADRRLVLGVRGQDEGIPLVVSQERGRRQDRYRDRMLRITEFDREAGYYEGEFDLSGIGNDDALAREVTRSGRLQKSARS
jgi:hypothetical protein